MKAINILLSILIFLLSAAAATFSYFLFEKRSQFVSGWAKMAGVIHQSAQKLDEGSGTKVAAELTPTALAHENYANLESLAQKLPAHAGSIITERNYLADALLNVNNSIGNKSRDVNENTLRSVDTYSKNTDIVVKGVKTVIKNRDRNYSSLINIAKEDFGVDIDQQKLIRGDSDVFSPLKAKLHAMQLRMRAYDAFMKSMGKSFGATVNPSQPEANIKALDTAVRKYRERFVAKEKECRTLLETRKRLKENIEKLNNAIELQRAQIADRNGQITSFQRAFGLSESRRGTTPWAAGSVEARAALEAKVVSVNSKYGYIAFDAGQYSVVQQQIGNRAVEVNPNIVPGLAMIVTRKSGKDNEFIARVQVSQVGELSSIANIPPDAKPIQIGDIVTVAIDKSAAAAAPAKKTGKR